MQNPPTPPHITKGDLTIKKFKGTYSYIGTCFLVNSIHVRVKFWSMAITVTIIMSHKQERMYHFMLEKKTLYITQSYTQCCYCLNSRAKLK
jgi:hypothetical protein